MTLHAPGGGNLSVAANELYVDGAYTGSQENGSSGAPYTTITAALAVGAANDVIVIRPETYTEDLTLVDGVDLRSQIPGSVTVVGSVTATDVTSVIQGINFIDDGAGNAFYMTGTAADTCRFIECEFNSTATGGIAFVHDNTAGTSDFDQCFLGATTGNANEVMQVEQGIINMKRTDVAHEDNTSESIVLEGDAATTFYARECHFTGQVGVEAAAVSPTTTLENCSMVVGADHALLVAATNTVTLLGINVTSTEASQDAIGGAGTVVVKDVSFLSTADEYETTLTVTHAAGSLMQHGTVAASGASPQVDAVTFPQVLPSVAYDIQLTFEATGGGADDVICSVDEGTIATTGFSIVTTSAAAAAISGNVHWFVIHD
jgi:hypothetical protein